MKENYAVRDLIKDLLNKEIEIEDLKAYAGELGLFCSVCGKWMEEENF